MHSFNIKMHHKSFGGRAQPSPDGGACSVRPDLARLMEGRRKEGGKRKGMRW